ncbi:MAG: GspH/FimT family pseudopilin [Candidatus Muiribacteriota bacterium]
MLKNSELNKSRDKCLFKNNQRGFTLLELMITVALIGIVAAIAFGSLQNLIPNAKAKSAARELRSNLQKARMDAVKNNNECFVVLTNSGGGNKGGAAACYDNNGDSDCDTVNDDMIFTFELDGKAGVEFENNGLADFTFNSRGLPDIAGTSSVKFTNNSGYEIVIELMPTGRIKIN